MLSVMLSGAGWFCLRRTGGLRCGFGGDASAAGAVVGIRRANRQSRFKSGTTPRHSSFSIKSTLRASAHRLDSPTAGSLNEFALEHVGPLLFQFGTPLDAHPLRN